MKRGLTLCFLLVTWIGAPAAAEKIVWKPLAMAVLKMDDRPVKNWNVFQAEKKKNLVLVQLGSRFLMLDIEARQLYELPLASLTRKGEDLVWRDAERSAPETPNKTLLPSEDWTIRDAGRVRRVRLRLAAEGRVLEVQLPQQPDLRKLY